MDYKVYRDSIVIRLSRQNILTEYIRGLKAFIKDLIFSSKHHLKP